jgi:TPR repeat protein
VASQYGHSGIVKLLLEAGADVNAGCRAAAQQGHSLALFNLAVMYQKGTGVEKNDKEALKCYLMAAEQNYREAQLALFLIYKNR